MVEPDGTVIKYYHNANNQRVAKEVNGTVTEKYLWKDLTTLLAVYNADDTLRTRFEYADNRMPYKTVYHGQTYYLSYDQVGTLRAVVKEDGTIVKTIEYDTFGNVLSDSNTTLKIPFGFAGGLYDPDTKLTRFGYRDYDAQTGKWTAKDPIGFDGGDTNLYGYVLGDPVDLVDPVGLVNLNLFQPYSRGWILAKTHGWLWPGYTIAAHGQPPLNQSGQGPLLPTPSQLRQMMFSNGYRGKGPVYLLSCNTGTGQNSYAQQLANVLNTTVYAPTSYYIFHLGWYSTSKRLGLKAFRPIGVAP